MGERMEITITNQTGPAIPEEWIGLFIEDINYAIDGGLHAEMIENRDFESTDVCGGDGMDYYVQHDGLYAWNTCAIPECEPSGQDGAKSQIAVVQGSPVHENSPHYLRVTANRGGCGFCNQAYDGIYMKPNLSYTVVFYARCVKYSGTITIAWIKDGAVVLQTKTQIRQPDSSGWNRWEKYELQVTAAQEIRGASFAVLLDYAGVLEFDHFSMMPQDALFGVFRKDLAQVLKDLHPGFLRFPGGCIVEGATLANRYQFKDTLADREERRHNWNRWALHGNDAANAYHSRYAHYGQTYGIGFYEYFLLCEYLGAKPLPVLGVGLACQFQSHERIEPDDNRIYEYIQDYLDLIEFANGSVDTKWGSLRAKMGHEKPFGLEMVGVGNEQWEDADSRFFERYALFEKEIHRRYPQIRLIGTAGPELESERFEAAWRFYREHEKQENFVYAVDEHCYSKPEWFLDHLDYFDHVSRNTKIFFGEYAAHPMGWMPMNRPEGNNLEGALAEAAFLTGMARNSDVVVMTCYAPLFARIGYAQWNPDLIWFDEKEAYRTPNYYVQQMFAQNLGNYNIRIEAGQIPCQVAYDEKEKELIVKLVNVSDQSKKIKFIFDDRWVRSGESITEITLSAKRLTDCNAIGKEVIRPEKKQTVLAEEGYGMAPYTFAVLRIPAAVRV